MAWSAVADVEAGAQWIRFGPFDDEMPSRFWCKVHDSDFPVEALIRLAFDGDEVTCESVEFHRRDGGREVRAEDLGRLQLETMIEFACLTIYRGEAPAMPAGYEGKSGRGLSDEELRRLAAIYWLHHVLRGSPRQAVMDALGIPRTTANRWIRRARELYGLPGGSTDGEHQEAT